MNRKRTASRVLLNRMPLFALIVVLIAVPVALLVSPPSDVVKAEGETGFKIKVLAKEGPPIYIPVDVNDSEVSGTFSRTIPAELGGHKDQSWSYTGKIDERQITGRLSFHEIRSIPNCGESEMNYEVSSTVLVIDDNNASSDWVTTTGNGRNKKTSYTFPVTLKFTADLTPLIEAGYEFAPAGTTGKTDGKTTEKGTEQESSSDKEKAATAAIIAGLTGLFVTLSTFIGGAPAGAQTAQAAAPAAVDEDALTRQALIEEVEQMRAAGRYWGGDEGLQAMEAKLLKEMAGGQIPIDEQVIRTKVIQAHRENLVRYYEQDRDVMFKPIEVYEEFCETYGIDRETLLRMKDNDLSEIRRCDRLLEEFERREDEILEKEAAEWNKENSFLGIPFTKSRYDNMLSDEARRWADGMNTTSRYRVNAQYRLKAIETRLRYTRPKKPGRL